MNLQPTPVCCGQVFQRCLDYGSSSPCPPRFFLHWRHDVGNSERLIVVYSSKMMRHKSGCNERLADTSSGSSGGSHINAVCLGLVIVSHWWVVWKTKCAFLQSDVNIALLEQGAPPTNIDPAWTCAPCFCVCVCVYVLCVHVWEGVCGGLPITAAKPVHPSRFDPKYSCNHVVSLAPTLVVVGLSLFWGRGCWPCCSSGGACLLIAH